MSRELNKNLRKHGRLTDDSVLFVEPDLLETAKEGAQEVRPGVYRVERLVTGHGWWTVDDPCLQEGPTRCTLFSVKGGLECSTTAAVLAWHFSRRGEHVLIIDLDLESPGLASAMLEAGAQPKFGVTDWIVEELVGQGDRVVEQTTAVPSWAHDYDGSVRVAPTHGLDPGEYLAKLARVYMETSDDPWTARLKRLLESLEDEFEPTAVLVESGSGLHDISAATVTDLDAEFCCSPLTRRATGPTTGFSSITGQLMVWHPDSRASVDRLGADARPWRRAISGRVSGAVVEPVPRLSL